MSKEKKVIVFGNNYWSSPYQVGSHYFARNFAQDGWSVLYISDPMNIGHLLLGRKGADTRARNRERGAETEVDGLKAYVPRVLLSAMNAPLLDSAWLIRNWWRLSVPNIHHRIESIGFHDPDLLFFNSLHFNWALDAFPNASSVFRIADWNPSMSELPRCAIDAQAQLVERAGLVVASSNAVITDFFSGHGDRIVNYLPNGLDLSLLHTGTPRPLEYAAVQRGSKIAVYVGAIDDRFDMDLVVHAALTNQNVCFFIVGKGWQQRVNNRSCPSNLNFLGPRPFSQIGSYLEHADMALMPQTRAYGATDYFNPLKLYQYMYYRLPVISTSWRELELLSPPISIRNSVQDFAAAVGVCSIDPYVDVEAYSRFLQGRTWGDSYNTLTGLLDDYAIAQNA